MQPLDILNVLIAASCIAVREDQHLCSVACIKLPHQASTFTLSTGSASLSSQIAGTILKFSQQSSSGLQPLELVCACTGTASPTGVEEAYEGGRAGQGPHAGNMVPTHAASAPPLLESIRSTPINTPQGEVVLQSFGLLQTCPFLINRVCKCRSQVLKPNIRAQQRPLHLQLVASETCLQGVPTHLLSL